MRLFIPSKGRPHYAQHNEELYAGFDPCFLVHDEETDDYEVSNKRVLPTGRFGKARAINLVLTDPSLDGQWVVFVDDDHHSFRVWDGVQWKDAGFARVLSEILLGIEAAEDCGACLVGGNSMLHIEQTVARIERREEPIIEYPVAHVVSGALYIAGWLFAVKVGALEPIPVTYDDEFMLTLESIWACGKTVENSYIDIRNRGILEPGGHGPSALRDRPHSIRMAERYGSLIRTPSKRIGEDLWTYAKMESDPRVIEEWRRRCPYPR